MSNRASETKQRILEAARKLFAEKGYDGVSMEDIAQASGVRKSLIYYYFPSKEVLFEEVWIGVIDELEKELFSEVESEKSISGAIKKLIRKYIEFTLNKSELSRLIARERMNVLENGESLSRAKGKYISLLSRLEKIFEKGKQENVLNDIEPSTATEIISTVDSIPRKSLIKSVEEFLVRTILKERAEH
ncbi:transcriptional regulator, TetR family [Fervidobacterium changbaicum]|uniref:TetR family transcriptional regulator n=2 Tax=Fervidobacterium TaxID=2422 RepID=A0AAI8GCS3_FERIS|nr:MULTISPECIES: TetR family transcriptional regulator [Fervidobacterium]AMW32258.1 TetR family transcriptional regulator [Fervidobacterium islandicum]QAV32402.1 TetR/AcrR family transcriptional regulator [Fervidobacterium changbaicum]SDH18278.1 transcriptional regulator, TetR family [Fervidobacterium changbaicum]